MKVTIAQLNPLVGDVQGNLGRILELLPRVSAATDLLVFPELFLVAYPPRDLLEKPALIDRTQAALLELVEASRSYPGLGLLVGAPVRTEESVGKGLYNAALLICEGRVLLTRAKSLLPTYDVFDETRYFDPGPAVQVVPFKDEVLGISICEDAWGDFEFSSRKIYTLDPIKLLADQKATLLINISASPFYVGKEEIRFNLIRGHARRHGLPFVYVNQVGGNDELIFDGRSLAVDSRGEPLAILPSFKEEVRTIDCRGAGKPGAYKPQEAMASIHDALVLGLRDYVRKCGFSRCVVGLSGGIDSAVVCCLAAQAIGRENVLGVSLPSPFTSKGSMEDAAKLAKNLGVTLKVLPITPIYEAYREALQRELEIEGVDVTLENIQARIRGNILMALSNRFGYLVLSTGNKSELAVGYCTLYGDMSGGLSVISDVPKTMVYELARYLNRQGEIIPREIFLKPPSAELRPDQTDQDTLPPYEILDQILNCYLNEGCSRKDLLKLGFDPEVVRWTIKTVDRNEYKRRQAAPGLKVTSKAFGMGRRIPIAARYES
jgi:NAD+ synthase (glutamine-hydrolysing)